MARLFDPDKLRPQELRKWQLVWEATGNVAAAWRCFRLARAWGLPVPSSVMAELDRIAIQFEVQVSKVRDGVETAGLTVEAAGRAVTRAGRGRSDPADALLAWERDFSISGAVAFLRYGGESERAAVERVSAGTTDLATKLCFEGSSIRLMSVTTPAISVDSVRQAVRRVRHLEEACIE